MFDLSRHLLFTEYTDPKSDVKSYVLTERVAGIQSSFISLSPPSRGTVNIFG